MPWKGPAPAPNKIRTLLRFGASCQGNIASGLATIESSSNSTQTRAACWSTPLVPEEMCTNRSRTQPQLRVESQDLGGDGIGRAGVDAFAGATEAGQVRPGVNDPTLTLAAFGQPQPPGSHLPGNQSSPTVQCTQWLSDGTYSEVSDSSSGDSSVCWLFQ